MKKNQDNLPTTYFNEENYKLCTSHRRKVTPDGKSGMKWGMKNKDSGKYVSHAKRSQFIK